MRAVVCQEAALSVADRPEPTARQGAGADPGAALRDLRLGPARAPRHRRLGRHGGEGRLRPLRPLRRADRVRPRVLRRGRRARAGLPQATSPAGTPVVALPLLRAAPAGVDTIGLSAHAPGAYAEQLLVEESLMMPVPNGLDARRRRADRADGRRLARRAPRRGRQGRRRDRDRLRARSASAVILMLKAKGVRTVVASDFSPGRRALAQRVRRRRRRRPRAELALRGGSAQGARCNDIPSALELAVGDPGEARAACPSAGGTPGGWPRRSAPRPSTR